METTTRRLVSHGTNTVKLSGSIDVSEPKRNKKQTIRKYKQTQEIAVMALEILTTHWVRLDIF